MRNDGKYKYIYVHLNNSPLQEWLFHQRVKAHIMIHYLIINFVVRRGALYIEDIYIYIYIYIYMESSGALSMNSQEGCFSGYCPGYEVNT